MRSLRSRARSLARCASLAGAMAAAGGAGAGCSPTLQAPAEAPTFHVDAQASEVWTRGPGATAKRSAQIRDRIAGAMFEMMQERDDLDAAPPARFSAKVNYGISNWPTAPCLFVLCFVGCPMSEWTFEVDLVLETGGKVYRGSGTHSAAASMYYDGDGLDTLAVATEKALAAALGVADGKERTEPSGADRKTRKVSEAEGGGP